MAVIIKRIGVLTGGGDCPGLNAVIRAVARNASQHGIETVGIFQGYEGLVEGKFRPLTDRDVSGILPRGGTILGTSNTANPFHYAEPDPMSGRRGGRFRDRHKDALEHIERQALDGLVIIGGDGTLTIAQKFVQKGVPLVGVPKTIDNDLGATDVTFGFDSAMRVAAEAIDALHTTAESHHRIMVVEVMGRYAGWIALRAGVAGGGDVILIPEIPYDVGKICDAIKSRQARGKNFSIVVAAEGAVPVKGQRVVREVVKGSPDPVRLGGIGHVVARQLSLCTRLESRVVVLGHLQRAGSPSPFDRWLATRFGVAAVDRLLQGKFGCMVALCGTKIVDVLIKAAIRKPRLVDPRGEGVRTARAVGTSFGD